jgi:vacuolar-type H+-ATPase subunit H
MRKNPETTMAGESVLRIKEKEKEASELVSSARLDAKKIVQSARDKKPVFIEEKDGLLKKEETRIRDDYMRQSEEVIRGLQGEEEREIKRISEVCQKNVSRVAEYVAREIVKD